MADDMTNELETLRDHIPYVRRIAAAVGPLHGYWDQIFTAEEVLKGGTFWPYSSREEAIRKCNESFAELRQRHGA